MVALRKSELEYGSVERHPLLLAEQLDTLIFQHQAEIQSIPEDWARELLQRPDVKDHIVRLTQQAQHILTEPLRTYRQSMNPNQKKIRSARTSKSLS